MDIMSSKIYLRYLKDTDTQALLDLNLRNKEFFQKYSPIHNDSFYTFESQRKSINDMAEQREKDRLYCFGIFTKDSNELIGDVSLFQICRGALESCLIGYSLDKEHNGKGYATEAVSLAVKFAFDELKLHRIEAGVMLTNIGSMRVLEKTGFHKEGIAQKNVKINGQWEDHQILAIISDKN